MNTHNHLPVQEAHFDFKNEQGHDNIWSRLAAEAWTSDSRLLHAQMQPHAQHHHHHHKHHKRHHHQNVDTATTDDVMEFEPINSISSWYDGGGTTNSAPASYSGSDGGSYGGSPGPSPATASDSGSVGGTVPSDVLADPRFTGTLDVGKPDSFFITQFGWPGWNPNGLDRSADCGPTAVAMAALAFGKFRSDVDPDQLIVAARSAMGASSDRSIGTGSDEVYAGAVNLGLQANNLQSTSLGDIDSSLARGGMAVVSGDPINYERELGFQDGTNNKYADSGTYDGGHWILVVGKDKENYVVNDPACKVGTIELSPAQLQTYMNGEGGGGIVQVHPS